MKVWTILDNCDGDTFVYVRGTEKWAYWCAFDLISNSVLPVRSTYEGDERYSKLLEAIDADDHVATVKEYNESHQGYSIEVEEHDISEWMEDVEE